MTEHVHEWDVVALDDAQTFSIFCAFKGCNKTPSVDTIITILNEYETLKKATDALSAEDAKAISSFLYKMSDCEEWEESLDTYANILEGK